MSKGNSIELVLSRSDDHDLAGYIYRWRGRVAQAGVTLDRFDQYFPMRGPELGPRQEPAPRPLGKKALGYFLAMCLALLFGLFMDMAIEHTRDLAVTPGTGVYWVVTWIGSGGGIITLVFAGWSIWLLRVAHSAFVLAEDREFHDEFDTGTAKVLANVPRVFTSASAELFGRMHRTARVFILRYFDMIAQIAVFIGSIVVLLMITYQHGRPPEHEQASRTVVGIALAVYCFLSGTAMLFWDWVPWSRYKNNMNTLVDRSELQQIMNSDNDRASTRKSRYLRSLVASGYLTARQVTLHQQFRLWYGMDWALVLLGFVCVGVFCMGWEDSLVFVEVVIALLLIFGSMYDWIGRRAFYMGVGV